MRQPNRVSAVVTDDLCYASVTYSYPSACVCMYICMYECLCFNFKEFVQLMYDYHLPGAYTRRNTPTTRGPTASGGKVRIAQRDGRKAQKGFAPSAERPRIIYYYYYIVHSSLFFLL